MKVSILLPRSLRPLAGGLRAVEVEAGEAGTAGDAMALLARRHPRLGACLAYAGGGPGRFASLYLGGVELRQLQGPATPVKDGDEMLVVTPDAGGFGREGSGPPLPAVAPLPGAPPGAAGKKGAGGPWGLDAGAVRRHSRHLPLPGVGAAGVARLRAGRALVVGVGGAGSAAALHLAGAGVGTIGLVDPGDVEVSGLQSQHAYSASSVGKPKAALAAGRLLALNPEVKVSAHAVRFGAGNALELCRSHDVVVDCTDEFPARYLIGDACALTGRPHVYGSARGFEGQVSVFWAAAGPCYRCLYPEPPPAELDRPAASEGAWGPLAGVVGAVQAGEALKLLARAGRAMVGRLLLFDALGPAMTELRLAKDPACPACGRGRRLDRLMDYGAVRGPARAAPAGGAGEPDIPEMTAGELAARREAGQDLLILDVREPWEREVAAIAGARPVPLGELAARIHELSAYRQKDIAVYSRKGGRSSRAVRLLRAAGFSGAVNVSGGIDAWSAEVDPSLPRY